MIKRIIKNILRYYGKEVVPYNDYEKRFEPVKFDWLKSFNIQTIIDVGASDGGYVKKIRPIFPQSKIYSFEVIEDSYQQLLKHFGNDPHFKAYNICLNNYNGICDFFINEYKGSSSLLKI